MTVSASEARRCFNGLFTRARRPIEDTPSPNAVVLLPLLGQRVPVERLDPPSKVFGGHPRDPLGGDQADERQHHGGPRQLPGDVPGVDADRPAGRGRDGVHDPGPSGWWGDWKRIGRWNGDDLQLRRACRCHRPNRHGRRRGVLIRGKRLSTVQEQRQIGADGRRRRISALDLVGEQLVDDRREAGRARCRQRLARGVRPNGVFELTAVALQPWVGTMAADHLVQDHAERPEVDVLVDATELEPFG